MAEISIYNQPNCVLPKSFFEGRFVPNVHKESLDYVQWWDEQFDRIYNGWSDGGFTVTGPNYYHLNFKHINALDIAGRPILNHPYYSEEDQQMFNDIALARSLHKGIILVTQRGWGKSFLGATIAEYEYTFFPATEVIVSASISKFADLLWSKIRLGINSQHPEIRLDMLNDKPDFIQAGKKRNDGSIDGTMSIIRKIIYDNDPGATRGGRPSVQLFDEIGSWSGAAKLITCYKMTEASWWRGSKFTCFPLLMGTGGQMETGASEDAKKMFFDPKAYNLMCFNYKDKVIGKFFPGYSKFEGFYEESGVSNKVAAKAFLDARRAEKASNPEMLRQEMMEYPYEPEEAFMTSSASYLPRGLMEERFMEIERDPVLQRVVKQGIMVPIKVGNTIVGAKFVPQINGPVLIAEEPFKDKAGDVPDYLHVSGCDSFDTVGEEEDKSGMKSKLSLKMYKRFHGINHTGNIFVASYTARTPDAREAYMQTFLLNLWYNAKMLYEHTEKGIGMWYIMNNYTSYLLKRPSLDTMQVIKKFTSTNRYGLAMPDEVKLHCIKRYGQYIKDNVHQMYFRSQLLDGIAFDFDSNEHDETMASSLAIVAADSLHDTEVREIEENNISWPVFTTDSNGYMNFGNA